MNDAPYPGEFAIDLTWSAIQALLTEQLGAHVNVDCIGQQDFDEEGDLTIVPPAARVLFIDETPGKPIETQAQVYRAEQYFAVICSAEDLSSVQAQRIASTQLAGQVKHLLVGARLQLADQSRTEPVEYCGTSPLPTAAGMAYAVKFCVPNIAQFSAPNANQDQGGN